MENHLLSLLGIEPDSTHAIAVLILVMIVANFIGRLIPDDATGVLAFVRKVCKVLGLYLSNRISSGVSVNNVARDLVDSNVGKIIPLDPNK